MVLGSVTSIFLESSVSLVWSLDSGGLYCMSSRVTGRGVVRVAPLARVWSWKILVQADIWIYGRFPLISHMPRAGLLGAHALDY